ncbi:hypothetical protein D9619_004041 [Psilocybe cf. subviscida]|uniref:NACHT domain-containing protein n=1 Tax=Psilocybe cf. subviscida TaxID=2480587 RepID=A0A8H5F7Q9_9AGAR|nr:hypothetical protein D9619_004041 [Psilocybe cf. subviscida]
MLPSTHTPDPGTKIPKRSLGRRVAAGLGKGIKRVFRRGDKGADDRAATVSLSDVAGGQGDENEPLHPGQGIGRMANMSTPDISDLMFQTDSPRTPVPLGHATSLSAQQAIPRDDNIHQSASVIQGTLGHQENASKAAGSIIGSVIKDPVVPADKVAPVHGFPPSSNLGSVSVNRGPPSEDVHPGASTQTATPSNLTENVMDALGVAGRFAKTLLKKLPDLAEPNPVKLALGVAKAVLEAKETIDGNKEEIAMRIFDISANLEVMEAATHDGVPKPAEAALARFTAALRGALKDLGDLKSASLAKRIFDYEEAAKQIQEIWTRMDTSRINFLTDMALSIQKTASQMADDIHKERLYRLRPSENADYKSVILDQAIRREECTAGTRVGILDEIEDWANDTAEDSPAVFWLTGQAGSGKTTIATTIATKFGGAVSPGKTVLGANFFCSRQFPETRNPIRIIPTIAYHLARKCASFADALVVGDKFDAVSYPVSDQLRSIFVAPWLQSESVRASSAPYLIVIDALDELADDGSTNFLNSLFNLLNNVSLKGFKILITSRSDPKIVGLIASFSARTERWLQRVPLNEVSSDIAKYLKLHLPMLSNEDLDKLEALADGLFIHAATTVRYLTPRSDIQEDEQMELLDELLQYTYRGNMSTDRSGSEFIIDVLYQHILRDALSASRGKQRQRRLSAIHMLLSTGERSSPSVISALLGGNGPTPEIVQAVVNSLHAVLYVQEGLIFWYHASFPDFIFDSMRSNFELNGESFTFSCDESVLQKQLRDICFTWLRKLKFNICNIPSSFLLDSDYYDVDSLLAYSAVNWSHHLPISGDPTMSLQEIEAFLELCALFWIELMNLVKQSDKCSSILHRAQRWVEQQPAGSD